MKTIERLILCILLVAMAYFVCGCKDKTEGVEFANCTFEVIEPNEPKLKYPNCEHYPLGEGTCTHMTWQEKKEYIIAGYAMIQDTSPGRCRIELDEIKFCSRCGSEFESDKLYWEHICAKQWELNKRKCEHKSIDDDIINICSFYEIEGSQRWQCPDCGEFVNTEELIFEPESNEPS